MPVRLQRGGTRAVVMMAAAFVLVMFVVVLFNGSAQATDSNQVDFWCDEGIKIEPIGTPSYTVPPPPDGFTWTLLVVKSATDNEVFPNPIPGQSYTPSNGHDVSHVILCMEQIPTTTLPPDPTTTTTTTTTLPPDPTTITDPPPVGGVDAGGGATAGGGSEAAVLWLAGGALALLGGSTVLAIKRSSERG